MTKKIDYKLASEAVILRDWFDVPYLNDEQKMLADIADSIYNVDISPDMFKVEYKELYDRYGKEYFDKVIKDIVALESQVYGSVKAHELLEEYNELMREEKKWL